MKLAFLHFRTLTMNHYPDGSLRWQRFTGLSFWRRHLGVFRDCKIDNQTALAEHERTWARRR